MKKEIKIGDKVPHVCGKFGECIVIGVNSSVFKGSDNYMAALHIKGTACACSVKVSRIEKEIKYREEENAEEKGSV